MTLPITGWFPIIPPEAATVAISVAPTITATGSVHPAGTVGIAVTPTVSASGLVKVFGSSAIVVTPTITATPGGIVTGTSAISVTPTVSAAGKVVKLGSSTITVTPTVSAAGTVPSGVAYDATGAGNSGSAAPGLGGISWTHVLGGAATALIVGVGNYANATNSCKIGSTSMTLIAQQENNAAGGSCVELWGLIDPPTGSQTITYTSAHAGTNQVYVNSVSYSGVASFGSAVTNYGSSTSLTTGNVSSASGDMVAAALSVYVETLTLTGSGTSRYNEPTTEAFAACLIQDIAGASTVTLTATASSSEAWGTVAVNLIS